MSRIERDVNALSADEAPAVDGHLPAEAPFTIDACRFVEAGEASYGIRLVATARETVAAPAADRRREEQHGRVAARPDDARRLTDTLSLSLGRGVHHPPAEWVGVDAVEGRGA